MELKNLIRSFSPALLMRVDFHLEIPAQKYPYHQMDTEESFSSRKKSYTRSALENQRNEQ